MVTISPIKSPEFERLLGLMNILRAQCPWDQKQTFESLSNLTIEEVYELVDAIHTSNIENVAEEVGDIMLHLVFYAKLINEQNGSTIDDILHKLNEKLIFRHPHIFQSNQSLSEAEVKKNWEQLKLKEGRKSILAGVPKSLPSMIKALRIQEKAAQVGFDWDHLTSIRAKLDEELAELDQAISNDKIEEIEAEMGDVFFTLINICRNLNIDPERALQKTNNKFIHRFEYIETHADKPLIDLTLEQMDKLWNESKES